MPRGPTVYSPPAGTVPQLPLTTILSATFNSFVNDVTNTFNTAQPIEYGGTNATNVADARTNLGISSAAVSAMDARRNLFVNSNFAQSQERGDVLGTSNGYFPADQIALYFSAATAAVSVQRVQIRTLANSLNQIEFKTTTAKAVLGANDFVTLTQPIEGSSIAEAGWGTAAAKPLVLRFQVTQPAGTYHVHVNNAAANRNISVPFIVAGGEANTAVVKTVTIPGDTTGTWLTADGVIGATFDIVLAAGTSLTGGTAGVWGASYLIAATAQFNILSSTANVARIADIGAKIDPDATGVYGAWKADVDAVYRSERYYWASSLQSSSGVASNTVNYQSEIPFVHPVRMAKNPSFTPLNEAGAAGFVTTLNPNGTPLNGSTVVELSVVSRQITRIILFAANRASFVGSVLVNARLT